MKGKKLLVSALTTAMLCTAAVGGTLLVANAEDGPTVGAFYEAWSGTAYSINGTSATESENKTKISYQWSAAAYNRVLVHVTGATAESVVEVALMPDADMAIQIWACNGEGDWDAAYGIQANESMTANTLYEKSFTLTKLTETELYLGFYFDSGVATDKVKSVVVDKLTVDGVSYQKTPYSAPVEAPDAEFKAYTDWTATNATVAANTLEKIDETDPRYADAVDNGAGKITLTDASSPATIEIPLTEAITAWPTAWTNFHIKAKITGISDVKVYIDAATPHDTESENAHLFCDGILGGGWNADNSKSATEGYRALNISSLGGFFPRYLEGGSDDWDTVIAHDSITKIVLVITPEEGASTAELDIAGMAFGGASAPVFINDPEYVPELEVGDWITWASELSLAQNDTVNGYTGATVSYNAEEVTEAKQFHVEIKNFDPELHPVLTIGFYTDCNIILGIAYGYDYIPDGNPKTYTAGYHLIDIDMKNQTKGNFALRFYLTAVAEPAAIDEDGEPEPDTPIQNHIVVTNVIFHNGEGASVLLDEYSAAAVYTVTLTEGKITWTWDASQSGWNTVNIPVENWHAFEGWIHLNVTFSHDMAFDLYSSGVTLPDPVHNGWHPTYAAGTYDLYRKVAGFTNGSMNTLLFYCDAQSAPTTPIIKTLTINSIEFVREAELVSSPNANVVTINYAEGKATYDDATYVVATDKNFNNVFASGSDVTPGMKLYIRNADGTSGITEITLPVTVLTEDMVTFNVITESVISTASHPGYQFRLGEDGEWKDTLGSWGNLEADTEYTIYVRIKASENGFASETISIKVKTLAASGGGTTNPGKDNKKGCKSSLSLVGVGAAVGALALGTAVVLFARKKKDN